MIQTNECYYEIDLGDPKHIQTIVTFGKYPSNRPFPRRKDNYNSYYYDTNKPYVNVVDIVNDDSYVTNYSVAYKDSQTQKWVHYNEFEGNVNSYTAKINPVDIYSRYIRIKPLEFVKTKSMIIYVYVSKNTNKNEHESEDEDEEVDGLQEWYEDDEGDKSKTELPIKEESQSSSPFIKVEESIDLSKKDILEMMMQHQERTLEKIIAATSKKKKTNANEKDRDWLEESSSEALTSKNLKT